MATSDSPLNVPNVTLAVARGASNPPPGNTGDPLVRFDFANGDTMSSPSVNTSGFSWDSTTRTIAQAPNGQLGLEFFYGGSVANNGGPDQYYTIGTNLFETYERIVIWIPSNFEHRRLMTLGLDTGQDLSAWVKGDVVIGLDGTSKGIYQGTDGADMWLKWSAKDFADSIWVGSITNATRSLSVTTVSRTFSPGSNNKFSAQWEGNYSGNGMIVEYNTDGDTVTVTEPAGSTTPPDSVFTVKSTAAAGNSDSDGGPDDSGTTGNRPTDGTFPTGIDYSEDRGQLHDFVIRRRRSSSLEALDGVAEIWKDGIKVYEVLNMPLYSSTANYFTRGYIMGAANSGFDEDTTFYVTKYELYDSTRPEGIPA